MMKAAEILDRQYHEMRARILSLAADLDRIQRGLGGIEVLGADGRARELFECIEMLKADGEADRAERVQRRLSE